MTELDCCHHSLASRQEPAQESSGEHHGRAGISGVASPSKSFCQDTLVSSDAEAIVIADLQVCIFGAHLDTPMLRIARGGQIKNGSCSRSIALSTGCKPRCPTLPRLSSEK